MALLIFIVILSILILVHEWGHYTVAKKCGVKVEQFALGFGPKLFGWTRDGTEFCLCAIPLGGFVKMAGDERDKCTGQSGEYFSKPAGQRALIILAGPAVNLLLAYACFWCVFKIGFVDMDLSSQNAAPVIGEVLANAPAQKAGLKSGDKIISINGRLIAHWSELQDITAHANGARLTFGITRGQEILSVGITPQESDTQDIFGRTHKIRLIGIKQMPISDAKDIVIVRYGFFQSFAKAGEELLDITVKTYTALYEMAIGARSPKEAMGIVGMYYVIKFALSIGFSFLLHMVGIISASLAIFNLLPVIPLDGGHLFLIGLEKLRGRALSLKTDQFIARAGFTLIIMLALFVFYSDFERIGLIDKIREVIHGKYGT